MKRRRLSDLYVRGTEVVLDDGQGAPVKVWVAKLNEVDRTAVVRRASAAKARYMIEAGDRKSDAWAAAYGQIREYKDRSGLIEIVVAEDAAKARARIEAERAADEDTWGKDGYLQGLVDLWFGDDDNPGLAAVEAEHPDDPEAQRVHGEIDRFEEEVRKLTTDEINRLRASWEDAPDEALWDKATQRALELRSEEAFLLEYDRQLLYHCVREPNDHAKRYFGSISEVDDLDTTVHAALVSAYNRVTVEPSEGKGWPANQDSSTSSASPAEQIPVASGQPAA